METERKETGREWEDEGAVRTMDHSKKKERERKCVFLYTVFVCMLIPIIFHIDAFWQIFYP